MSESKITREQLESTLAGLQGGLEGTVNDKKKSVAIAGGVVALLVLLLVFTVGKRAGKKKTTIVEIRRV
ncbi:MAG: hypothetical protein R2715_09545 [Ilumatobacteraceae bacterium]